jgi:hypothetical protein
MMAGGTSNPEEHIMTMVENPNIAIVQQIYRNFLAGDMDAVLDAFAEDIDWGSTFNWRGSSADDREYEGRRLGRRDVAEALEAFRASVKYEEPTADNHYVVAGNRVIVTGQDIRRVLSTGERTENRWSMVWTINDGKVVHFRVYQDTVPVLE